MRVEFQYLKRGELRPDVYTITDADYNIQNGCLPNKGDYVMLQVHRPKDEEGHIKHFEIIARHFFYSTVEVDGDLIQQDSAIFVVTDAPNLPEMNFRE